MKTIEQEFHVRISGTVCFYGFSTFSNLEAYTLLSLRTAVKAVVERLTQSSFYTSARALFERDRSLFALLCALEVNTLLLNVSLLVFLLCCIAI